MSPTRDSCLQILCTAVSMVQGRPGFGRPGPHPPAVNVPVLALIVASENQSSFVYFLLGEALKRRKTRAGQQPW
jgi:hypothetical protein